MRNRSYLSVDIGEQHTRAWLFDDRGGMFALRASSTAETTCRGGADVRTGVTAALRELQEGSGRALLDQRGNLRPDKPIRSYGIHGTGLSLSAGRPIRTALVGVSAAYSMAALRRLVSLFDTEVVMEINLQDDLNATAQLQQEVSKEIELFVIAGGVDGGATRPVMSAIENIRLAYHIMPRSIRPQVVYCGNRQLASYAQSEIEAGEDFHLAGNIIPEVGVEDLASAWPAMQRAFQRLRLQQIPGLKELHENFNCKIYPTVFAAGRVARLLARLNENHKGVMVVDIGAGSTDIVAAHGDRVYGIIHRTEVTKEVIQSTRDSTPQMNDPDQVPAYLLNRQLHPGFLPQTLDDLAIEQTWARIRIQAALTRLKELYPCLGYAPASGLREAFEPIILSGASMVNSPSPVQPLIMAVDGIMPHGITTITLDDQQVLPALGTLAEVEPLLAIQVIDSDIFTNLGTVITVDSPEPAETRVLDLEVDEGGDDLREQYSVFKSALKRIEMLPGAKMRVYLSPSQFSDVGMGIPGLGGWVTIPESRVGVLIDARGRPVLLPADEEQRMQTLTDWMWELGN